MKSMPRVDSITNKKPMSGNSRSNAMNATSRKFDLNLQKVTVMENGQKKRIRVTAKTAKTLRKNGRVA